MNGSLDVKPVRLEAYPASIRDSLFYPRRFPALQAQAAHRSRGKEIIDRLP